MPPTQLHWMQSALPVQVSPVTCQNSETGMNALSPTLKFYKVHHGAVQASGGLAMAHPTPVPSTKMHQDARTKIPKTFTVFHPELHPSGSHVAGESQAQQATAATAVPTLARSLIRNNASSAEQGETTANVQVGKINHVSILFTPLNFHIVPNLQILFKCTN